MVESQPVPPSLSLGTMLRLGLFQASLGVMSILTLGVLNRVMIDELRLPALLVAGAIAMHQFVAPVRVWFGQLSDTRPLWGLHRSGYIWLGSATFCLVASLAVRLVWPLATSFEQSGWGGNTWLYAIALGLTFALYGVAISASSTPFAALLVDVTDERTRPKLVSIVWSMLMVGIVIGGITTGILLKSVGAESSLAEIQGSLQQLFTVVPLIVFGTIVLATVGVERRYSGFVERSQSRDREDSITLGRALRVLTASRQTGFFFAFLAVLTFSLFLQEAILEPYAGQVFGFSVGQSSQLNAYWGFGTLIGTAVTGFLVVPKLGKERTAQVGCGLSALCFCLIIAAGWGPWPTLLRSAIVLFGLGAGIATSGSIILMLDFTLAETAGTFIGAWGLAQALSRAIATVSGGAIFDLGKLGLSAEALAAGGAALFPAYALVFAVQALGMLVAIACLSRVNVQEFRQHSRVRLSDVLAAELD
ncbi:BCD family MFS transporter [Synechococcus elongatus]|uniref:BCD family MFS transporter n=1 Tax=Synechococcus elongatus TaxID=32046 RepID=UPI0030D501CC